MKKLKNNNDFYPNRAGMLLIGLMAIFCTLAKEKKNIRFDQGITIQSISTLGAKFHDMKKIVKDARNKTDVCQKQ